MITLEGNSDGGLAINFLVVCSVADELVTEEVLLEKQKNTMTTRGLPVVVDPLRGPRRT